MRWQHQLNITLLVTISADITGVPGEAGVRHAPDEDHKVHGERHLHALQLWSQPEGGVPAAEALQDGARGGGQQQGGHGRIRLQAQSVTVTQYRAIWLQ